MASTRRQLQQAGSQPGLLVQARPAATRYKATVDASHRAATGPTSLCPDLALALYRNPALALRMHLGKRRPFVAAMGWSIDRPGRHCC